MKIKKTVDNINQEMELEKIVKIESIEELDKANGASAVTCTAVGGAIAASVALCPTTKCSSQCGKRN